MLKFTSHRMLLLLVTCTYTIKANNLRRALNQAHQQLIEFGSFQFWLYAIISFTLSCFAGVCSGLTVGYMAISKSEMELWKNSNDDNKKRIAIKILQILENHHFLLSTLLLSNALALEALPIFLDKIVPSFAAIFISTAAVVIFGEVLPQAYCTGQHKTVIGYYMAPFIKFLQCILYPFVKPIVLLLDKIIDHEEGHLILDHEKIKNLLLLHNKKQYGYRPQEIEMLQNCLDLRLVSLSKVMIPLEKVFMVEADCKVDQTLIKQLLESNYSKFPVYEKSKQKVVGFVKSKKLIQYDILNPKSLREGNVINNPVYIDINQTLLDTIDILKTKRINFGIVVKDSKDAKDAKSCVGIITLKQIFDKIVLKKFKDKDIRVHIHLNKHVRNDEVIEAVEQE